ncbi:DUF5949 family protein [Streptomyces sp. VRA16 Mangrove soil]|uniref:DUF5949 family protein n=1 Tax=Streptomyces sp. VRA16 Mangrove soil TaxID=2817434 RepID=UPI001AA006E8|nr:DUF5949 family protein [Streptomyces sp. VRA16 Mangrove soil]MBO1337389.1 hypothetical protein [Streptomyces sp. VRA16 Mangrove soil]
MTSTSSIDTTFRAADLGTLAVIAWSGERAGEEGDMPFLLAYSMGDSPAGPDASEQAVRALLLNNGLTIGTTVHDGARHPSFPVSLLVEAGQAVVSMPLLNAQCPVPPEWLVAAEARGNAYFVFTTRPWPTATPGRPVTEEQLAQFAGAEETLTAAAHCLLPIRRIRS